MKYSTLLLALGLLLGPAERLLAETAACWLPPLYPNAGKEFNPEKFKGLQTMSQVTDVLGPLKKNWTAAYNTESPQQDDYRVITFSPEERAIVAYTGCPTSDGEKKIAYPKEDYPSCEQVEVMLLKSPEEKIELWAYQLPGKGKNLPVKVIGPNDKQCTTCHGEPPNAKWEAYNSWPGFFGSRSRNGEDVMRKGSKEHELYKKFMQRVFANPDEYRHYSQLTWRLNDKKTPQAIEPEDLKFYEDKGEFPVRVMHSSTTAPNPALNKMLSEWRGRMMVKDLTATPDYPKTRYAVMAMALSCDVALAKDPGNPYPITYFLPPSMSKVGAELLNREIDESIKQELDKSRLTLAKDSPFDGEGTYRVVGTSPTSKVERQVKALAYLWRMNDGLHSNWNTTNHQMYNFNDGQSATGPIFKTLWQYNDKCDPEMKEYSKYLSYDSFDGVTAREEIAYDSDKPVHPELKRICTELALKGKRADGKGRDISSIDEKERIHRESQGVIQ